MCTVSQLYPQCYRVGTRSVFSFIDFPLYTFSYFQQQNESFYNIPLGHGTTRVKPKLSRLDIGCHTRDTVGMVSVVAWGFLCIFLSQFWKVTWEVFRNDFDGGAWVAFYSRCGIYFMLYDAMLSFSLGMVQTILSATTDPSPEAPQL